MHHSMNAYGGFAPRSHYFILCLFIGLRTLVASRHNCGSLQKALDLLCGEVGDANSFAKSFVHKILHCLRRKRLTNPHNIHMCNQHILGV